MSTTARKRLLKDFKRLQHDPPPGVQVRFALAYAVPLVWQLSLTSLPSSLSPEIGGAS